MTTNPIPDAVTQAIAELVAAIPSNWAWSIRTLRDAQACDLGMRIHDLNAALGRVVPEDEKVPAHVWLGLPSTTPSDIRWAFYSVQDAEAIDRADTAFDRALQAAYWPPDPAIPLNTAAARYHTAREPAMRAMRDAVLVRTRMLAVEAYLASAMPQDTSPAGLIDALRHIVEADVDEQWRFSIADLHAAGACHMNSRIADLCRSRNTSDIPDDEDIPAIEWLALPTTSSPNAAWVLWATYCDVVDSLPAPFPSWVARALDTAWYAASCAVNPFAPRDYAVHTECRKAMHGALIVALGGVR